MSGRKDFLSQPAPENYVAGLGRGATGFTTRSDLGPAREGPSEDQIKEALAKRAAQLGAAPPTAYGATEKKEDDDDDERFQDPENETGLFANGQFDRDDDEADRIYQDIDERMEKRRKSRREAREAQERADYEANNPKIQQQFADLKRSLASVSEEDWANLPEAGDLTRKNKRTKAEARNKFYVVPDSVIAGARDSTQMETSVVDDGSATNGGGVDSMDGTMTNFADIGAARDKVLQVRLDQAAQSGSADSSSGMATNIDPKGYLTSLSKSELKAGEVEVGDINRVRALLESVIKTNSRHAPGYLALSRLEELAGKIVAARNVIAKGCEVCGSQSEDVWLEAIRLSSGGDNHNGKIIAANALKAQPQSTRLWIQAMELENTIPGKKRVMRKAADFLSKSVVIWKEMIKLEDSEQDAKLLLAKATEEIPLSVELWLAYARLVAQTETPENAQKVLNKARLANPSSHLVWIAASRLSEETGKGNPEQIIRRAIQSLARENAMLKREEWVQEAEKCETEGAIKTAACLIRETLGYGLDEDDDDRKNIWMEDAQASVSRSRYETARAIYAYALRVYFTSKKLWRAAVDLEKAHGTPEALFQLMEKSVEAVPDDEGLWMMYAREKWRTNELDEARKILGRAFNQNPESESIYLSAFQLEADNNQISAARELLRTARQEASTDRVWYKSVAFERQQGDKEAALDLCQQALNIFPSCWKLHALKGQVYASKGQIPQAREAYNIGTRACPTAVPLFILLSRLEEASGVVVKARSVLERGLMSSPKSADLRLEAIRVERRAGNIPQAKSLMAKALQALPTSGLLWSESIWYLEARTQRKPRSLEAIKKCDNDPTLFVTVARVFWNERKLDKAANWFEKAILLDADLGDTWAWYVRFLMQHGTEEKRKEVLEKCVANEPRHGEVWQQVRKEPASKALGTEEVLMRVVRLLDEEEKGRGA